MIEFEWHSEKERLIAEKHGIDMELEQIQAAQKRHAAIDPACVHLTPEEFINWHPVGGMSWDERAQRMKAAGITNPELAVIRSD